jgi:non-homologous end joining protein Ku
MAPRANWKGFLRLSLVTCPVALYPATSDSEKISFNQINRKTGHRIRRMHISPARRSVVRKNQYGPEQGQKVVLLSAGGRSRWLPCSKKLPMTDFSEITALRHCDRL